MPGRVPTYKDRAIATGVNNASGWRDLIIELAEKIDEFQKYFDTIAGENKTTAESDTDNGD